ncbi:uncharacterized protein RHOBADRAFT_55020 [Rhodotorula graminis WP1]|uniref:Las1-domain-containing protein n=1 Tax=Rhodotorula graminis (strain WP1) TaxID=578459 RepID=A0A0P9GJN6_RHOGW|nr:uncharacterized protein RHOBADRAFT_55020 [Rhodotorula graminis WP1]KPV73248.1 hypothetical protein RHOBADRAFT_55020 [Rhodotorula graminis WP1]
MAPVVVPRKTPWSTHLEFHLVFDRLFNSDGDPTLQRDAITRIRVWLDRGNCPHPVETTANLVALVLRDSAPSSSSSSFNLAALEGDLRLAYAMAIVRAFVNSLVDPLQTAYFARSIASLAAQLGLPLWFVELRHQATHEDLPRLSVLRDAARQALDWLYANYWLPALSSLSSSSTLSPLASLPPLSLSTLRPHLLTTYKALLKSSTRDASLAGRLRADIHKCYRDIERWVAENSLGGGPRGREGAVSAEKARERALEGVAEVLWSEGGLVPLAKKKRPTPRAPSLPSDLLAVWTPLLAHLDTVYDGQLSPLIVRHGLDLLTSPTSANELDRSYVATVVAWCCELLRDAPVEAPASVDEDDDDEEDATASVKGVIKACLLARTAPALTLVEALLASRSATTPEDDPAHATLVTLQERVAPLVQLARAQLHAANGDFTQPLDADTAAPRLDALEAQIDAAPAAAPPPAATTSSSSHDGAAPSAAMQLDALPSSLGGDEWPPRVQGWKARPVGAFPRGGVLALDLPAVPLQGVAVA